jgi:hypothetical protein
MTWRMQFYNERRGILARYNIDAPLPAEATRLGWKAVLAEHPSTPRTSRLSLFELAERIGGQDASGWVLYRIAKDVEHESPNVAAMEHEVGHVGRIDTAALARIVERGAQALGLAG